MTEPVQILELRRQRNEANEELNDLIHGGRHVVKDDYGIVTDLTERRKEVLADRINELTLQIERLSDA